MPPQLPTSNFTILPLRIEARTRLDILVWRYQPVAVKVWREVAVAEYDGTGITAAELAEKSEERLALGIRARVGRTA